MDIKKQHVLEVEELGNLEGKLSDLIAETENGVIMQAFIKWQEQRLKCNETYIAMIDSMSSAAAKSKEDAQP